MNRLKIAATTLVLPLLICTCAGYNAVQQAKSAENSKDFDQAVMLYEKALSVDPQNARVKMALRHAKLEASRSHFEKGKGLRNAAVTGVTPTEQLRLAQMALTELDLTVRLDPTNQYASVELGKAQAQIQDLTRPPDKPSIAELKKRAITKAQPPQLNPASTEPISLSFARETPVKEIYRALGNAFGINVLFDQAVKDDRISIELKDVTTQQALERVMQAANHFYKVLDQHTIIVVPDNPQARRDYEDLVIRTFYLSNGDAEQITNVVRTMIEARNVFPLKALNAITIRDTADKVRIAEKIIEANDKAKAEVVVDVELVQLDVNKLRDLGLTLGSYSVGAQIGTKTTPPTTTDTSGTSTTGTTATTQIGYTLDFLRHLSSGDLSFTVPSSATLNFIKNATDSESLANPQLRILEGEKATLHIGKRIPVPVTTFSSVATGGTSTFAPATSFQYQDVGIKVSMEPRVHHNREVTLKLTVEVSDQAGSVSNPSGPPQPIIATRTIEDTIRLKDGETNFLAGLIQHTDQSTKDTTPFLGDLPLIGRFFNHENKQHSSTDLMLTLTPHIIRVADITEDDQAPMWVGTTNNITFRGVSPRIESRAAIDPFTPPRTADQFTASNPGGAIQVAPNTDPSTLVRPEVKSPIPTGGAPTDPFNKPAVVKPPEPEASLNPAPGAIVPGVPVPVLVAGGTPVSQGTAPTDYFKTAAASASTPASSAVSSGTAPTDVFNPATAAATAVTAAVPVAGAGRDPSLAPRLSPQPINMTLKPGEERIWNLMGMDLEGLLASSIVLHFNANAMDVSEVQIGPAITVDPASPPSVAISRENGTIRIASTNGRPLAFAGGGLVAALRVHGGAVAGEAFLVVENPALQTATGDMVAATIGSGHLHIQ